MGAGSSRPSELKPKIVIVSEALVRVDVLGFGSAHFPRSSSEPSYGKNYKGKNKVKEEKLRLRCGMGN